MTASICTQVMWNAVHLQVTERGQNEASCATLQRVRNVQREVMSNGGHYFYFD
jgi:hypothetical protein